MITVPWVPVGVHLSACAPLTDTEEEKGCQRTGTMRAPQITHTHTHTHTHLAHNARDECGCNGLCEEVRWLYRQSTLSGLLLAFLQSFRYSPVDGHTHTHSQHS